MTTHFNYAKAIAAKKDAGFQLASERLVEAIALIDQYRQALDQGSSLDAQFGGDGRYTADAAINQIKLLENGVNRLLTIRRVAGKNGFSLADFPQWDNFLCLGVLGNSVMEWLNKSQQKQIADLLDQLIELDHFPQLFF